MRSEEEQAKLNQRLLEAAEAGDFKDVKSLLQAGANVNATDIEYPYHTPLHWSTAMGHTKVVEVLIKAGADVNKENIFGETPLHWSAWNGHTDTAILLIKAGANVYKDKQDKITPLYIVKSKGDEFYNKIIYALANLINETNKGQAFLMGTHDRLGAKSPVYPLGSNVVKEIVQKAAPTRITLRDIPEEHRKAVQKMLNELQAIEVDPVGIHTEDREASEGAVIKGEDSAIGLDDQAQGSSNLRRRNPPRNKNQGGPDITEGGNETVQASIADDSHTAKVIKEGLKKWLVQSCSIC